MPMRSRRWIKLISLLGGYSLAGGLLSTVNASLLVWLLIEGMILHLSWAGTSAIALSVVGVTSVMWLETITIAISANRVVLGVPLSAAQVWASALALSWLLAMLLAFLLAFTSQQLNEVCSKTQAFWLLVLVTNLGLAIGWLTQANG